MPGVREVRKRDDRVIPFDSGKITAAIYKAVRSVGKGDSTVAEELSAAVVHFLQGRFVGRIPRIEEIQDVVETVLVETGHTEIAKAYILYRQKRATLRETLQVRKSPSETAVPMASGPGAAVAMARGPWVEEEREGVSPWAKSKITAALIREADVDPAVAAEIAAAVEIKVFDSGIQRISTSLLRELVDNELFERGCAAKLQRQVPLGLPKYDLEQIIFGLDSKKGSLLAKTPVVVREFIASRILRQYALQEVFSAAVAEAHRNGRLHVHRLEDPIRFDELIWDLPFPLASRPGRRVGSGSAALVAGLEEAFDASDSAVDASTSRVESGRAGEALRAGRGAQGRLSSSCPELENAGTPADTFLDQTDLFRRVGHLGQFVHGEIRLRSIERLLAAGPRVTRGELPARIRGLLERLEEIEASLPGSGLALELRPGDASVPWLEALLARDGALKLHFAWDPAEILDERCRPSVELAAELFTRTGRVEFVPCPGASEEARRGMARSRRSGLLALASKVTINLPGAAFRAVKCRSGRIEEELDEVVDLALKALLERRQFLSRLGAKRENPLWDVLGRPQDSGGAPLVALEEIRGRVGLVGLNECVKFVTGHEFHQDPRAVTRGLEIVAGIRRRLRREARGLGLRVDLEETPMSGAISRLESLDRRSFPQFEEVERGRSHSQDEKGEYTGGVRIEPAAPVDPLRRLEHVGRFLTEIMPRGLLDESPELRQADSGLTVCLLEEASSALLEVSSSR